MSFNPKTDYIIADCPLKIEHSIKSAIQDYTKKYHLRKSTLLYDYYKFFISPRELKNNFMAYDLIQTDLQIPHVMGVLERETAMEQIVYQLYKKETPTHVIRQLLYPAEDDEATLECGLVLNLFEDMPDKGERIRVVNPSPMVLEKLADSDCAERIEYIAENEILSKLYSKQFPANVIQSLSDAAEEMQEVDTILVLGGLIDYAELRSGLKNCSTASHLIALLPEKALTGSTSGLYEDLQNMGLSLSWAMIVPSALKAKNSQKKCLLFAERMSGRKGKVSLYTTKYDPAERHLFVSDNPAELSVYDLLTSGKTLRQIAAGKIRPALEPQTETKHKGVSDVYLWSKEIPLRFNLLTGRKGRCALRVSYRYRDQDGKKKTTKPIECCRGENLDECLRKLEPCLLEDRFFEPIEADIRQRYNEQENLLTVKTLWILCRRELQSRTAYKEAILSDLLLNAPSVAWLVPDECRKEDFLSAFSLDFGMDAMEVEHKYWLQMDILLTCAQKCGYISLNELRPIEQQLSQRSGEKQKEVLNALKRKNFTEAEEAQELQKLYETGQTDEIDSYVKSGRALAELIKFFTPLDNGELCALCWGDMEWNKFVKIWQLKLTKYLTSAGEPQPIANTDKPHAVRYIPLPPELVFALKKRKNYLSETFSAEEKYLRTWPILAEDAEVNQMIQTGKVIWPSRSGLSAYFHKQQRLLLLTSDEINLPDERTSAGKKFDLQDFSGDIFRNNYAYRYKLCGGTPGELAYLMNRAPEDTRSKSYHDYSADLSQVQMLVKLCRWTSRYGSLISEAPKVVVGVKELEREMEIKAQIGMLASAEMVLGQSENGEYRMLLDADYGLTFHVELEREAEPNG